MPMNESVTGPLFKATELCLLPKKIPNKSLTVV